MIIAKIIFNINLIVWLIPPLRQKGCRYFLFFLLLALSDPGWFILNYIQHNDSSFYYLIISTLILAAVLNKNQLLLLLIPMSFIKIFLNNPEIRIFTIIIHFILLLYFLREFLLIISRESRIVLFNLILLLYEASVLFKFSASYFITAGYLFFYITTAFEILIAVFFSLVNEKNSPVLKLQMEPDQGGKFL
jgi:hypothetical protein